MKTVKMAVKTVKQVDAGKQAKVIGGARAAKAGFAVAGGKPQN